MSMYLPCVSNRKGFLQKLRDDKRAASMPMMVAAIFPMLGLIGGAVDMSRGYLVRTRLQQACDAGALAARRSMQGNSTLNEANKAEGAKFFLFNFPVGLFGSQNTTHVFNDGTVQGSVVGAASTTFNTYIVRIFGLKEISLNVTCSAVLNVPNTDVMFVLDTSGSMKDTIPNDTQTKASALQQATKDFFLQLGSGAASGPGRIRYGFMPYSSNVNTGKLVRAKNAGYILSGNWTYQTRVPDVSHTWTALTQSSTVSSGYGGWSNISNNPGSQPITVGGNSYATVGSRNTACSSYTAPVGEYIVTTTTTDPSSGLSGNFTMVSTKYQYVYASNGRNNYCFLQSASKTVDTASPGAAVLAAAWTKSTAFQWNYTAAEYNTSEILTGATVPNPSYWDGAFPSGQSNIAPNSFDNGNPITVSPTMSWSGCLEEAQTSNISATASMAFSSLPPDMQIDLKPDSTETKWKPWLPAIVFDRNHSNQWQDATPYHTSGWAICPSEASKLTQYTDDLITSGSNAGLSQSFVDYVNGLSFLGGTQHDIGMIWGARFMSADGIFGDENNQQSAPGGFEINRHIVFMTDGLMDARKRNYGPWGLTSIEGRQAPTSTMDSEQSSQDMNNIHYNRMVLICNAAKAKGYTIWVIGFGISSLPDALKNCASDADHAAIASDAEALKTQFKKIADTIGGLRIAS